MSKRFSVDSVFRAVDKITAPVARMGKSVGKFTRKMEIGLRRVAGAASKIGGAMKSAAIVTGGALLTVGVGLLDVIKTGAKFEQTIVSAAAKFPGEIKKGTAAFDALSQAAKQTGKTTEFSASQAAEGLNFLAMAGFSAEAAVAALPGVVDLATAANIELGAATDIATDSLGAFGLATKDPIQLGKNLARVNDVIAKTSTGANTTVEQMFEAIAEGAPVATGAGASMETFAALVGKLADAGIKGGKAGTTLKNVFLSLSAPTGRAAGALEDMGITTRDQEGNLRDVVAIFGEMEGALGKLGTAERSEVLKDIFGKIPIAGVNVLLETGAKNIDSFRTGLVGASGANKEMAATMRDTVIGSFNSLTSSIEGVKISIFDMNKGPLKDVINSMTEWVRTNEKFIASTIGDFLRMLIDNFENIVIWVKRIGIALAVFATATIILKSFILVMTALNIVMALNPIGLIVLGVAALVVGIIAAITWIASFTDAFDGLGDAVDAVAGFFGFGDEEVKVKAVGGKGLFGDGEEAGGGAEGPPVAMVSPQERVARSIEERRETSRAEVTITDQTGRARVAGDGKLPAGVALESSGSF